MCWLSSIHKRNRWRDKHYEVINALEESWVKKWSMRGNFEAKAKGEKLATGNILKEVV